MIKQGKHLLWRPKFFLWMTTGLLLVFSAACNTAGLFNATETTDNMAALESTVAAMNATFEAISARQAQATLQTPNVIIVTATSTNTPISSPTPVPTPTPLPTATPIPTATPVVSTDTPAPQGKTIAIIVTPTLPSTATPYPEAPIISAPREGTIVAHGEEILLSWSWNGLLLEPDEYFEIKLRPDQQSRSAYIAQERGLAHQFKANLGGGRYLWTVQIVQGYWLNDSGHPDDWVLQSIRSAESAPRLIIVDDSDHDNDDDD